jgi:alpha-tubulin suppressor-like RCC1 family protein
VGVLTRTILLAIVVAGCYAPASLAPCKLECSADEPKCPDGAMCGGDNYCHEPGDTMMCGPGGNPATFTQIDLGSAYSCGIKGDKSLWCWGADGSGQLGDGGDGSDKGAPVRVGMESDWIAISAGQDHACGIRQGGALYCWGDDNDSELGDGGSSTPSRAPIPVGAPTMFKAVAAGYVQTCAIDTMDKLWCWSSVNIDGLVGAGDTMPHAMPTPIGADTWKTITAGQNTTCGVKMDGTLWCWGQDWSYGLLGDGMTNVLASAPQQVMGFNDWESVAVGYLHSCALRGGGLLYCWGQSGNGSIGDGGFGDVYAPEKIGTDTGWSSVTVGVQQSCAIRASKLYCWGWPRVGEVGTGDRKQVNEPTPIAMDQDWMQVAAGEEHTCAIRMDGQTFCWGDNRQGELGEGMASNRHSPTQVGTAATWSTVRAGRHHTCALQGSDLYCWGENDFGELGVGDTVDHLLPVQVPGAWKQVALGEFHTCAIDSMDHLYCWGADDDDQLGNGPGTTDASMPAQIGSMAWTDIASDGDNNAVCGISVGKLYCWGGNENGQLGTGTMGGTVPSPMQVGMGFTQVEVGATTTCGVSAGQLFCAGMDDHSQIPNGPGEMDSTMLQSAGTSLGIMWSQVQLGVADGCTIGNMGQLACWGQNGYGEDLNGMAGESSNEVNVSAGHMWMQVGLGETSTCALRDDGKLYCAGQNYDGRIGDGTTNDAPSPVLIPSGANVWKSIAVGYQYACGVEDDDTLWCWGDDEDGQLGNGQGPRLAPVPVVNM